MQQYLLIFSISAIVNFFLIKFFNKRAFFQPVRSEIQEIREKQRTPTAGGIGIMLSIWLWCIFFGQNQLPIIMLSLAFSTIGFSDDWLKLTKQKYHGLRRNYRLLFEIFFSAIFVLYTIISDPERKFISIFNMNLDLGWLTLVWGVWIIIACANSLNLTDGIDSLASTISIYIFIFFFICTQDQLALTIISGIAGFLVFNFPPAKIYMGDTGSLGIGAMMGAMFFKAKLEFWLLLIGIVLVIETVSVIIQIYSVKKFNKRFFLMAPLHHHFEKLNWPIKKILLIFNLIAILTMIVGILIK